MNNLYPTPTRLDLLAAIDRRQVWQSFEGDMPVIREDEHRQRKVTDKVGEMERAGWVHMPGGSSLYALTDEGRVVMERAAETKEHQP